MRAWALLVALREVLLCSGLRTVPTLSDAALQPSYTSDKECPARVAPGWSVFKVSEAERSVPQELVSEEAQLQRAVYRRSRGKDHIHTPSIPDGEDDSPLVECDELPQLGREVDAAYQQRRENCLQQQANGSKAAWPRPFAYKHSTTRAPTWKNWTKPVLPPFQPVSPVEYKPELFKAWLDWEKGPAEFIEEGASAEAAGERGTLAVLLTGTVNRFLFPEFLKNVVGAARLQGYKVDVYMNLVQGGNGAIHSKGYLSDFIGDPMLRGLWGENLTNVLTKSVELAGGRMAKLRIQLKEEDIDPLPEDNATYQSRSTRITLYSPYTTEIGRNVLRRWKTIRGLMRSVELESQARGTNYTWVLELREDLLWVQPLDLRKFNVSSEASLFGIDCLLYGGINDKALLYNQNAGSLLAYRYGAFYNTSNPMLDNCHNAESYLGALVTAFDIPVTLVPVSYIGAVSTMYRNSKDGELEVCVRKTNQMHCVNPYYMPEYCDPADHTMMRRKTSFCSDIEA